MIILNLFSEQLIRVQIWYYQLALQNIDPSHEDVPEIVMRLVNLSDKLDELKCK